LRVTGIGGAMDEHDCTVPPYTLVVIDAVGWHMASVNVSACHERVMALLTGHKMIKGYHKFTRTHVIFWLIFHGRISVG
jgi:hypothetical protein